ncbi:MAG: hypothetical protein RIB61_07460 [Roseicyclus sp.]
MRIFTGLASLAIALASLPGAADAQTAGQRINVRGEIIDTWCYFSGVMGGPDAVVGSAHHTCAIWCSAGGIPVGLLAEDGTVYMVLRIEGSDESAGGGTQMRLASHVIEVDGMHYERDGLNYLIVSDVVVDDDIQVFSHDDFGVVPGFAVPEDAR